MQLRCFPCFDDPVIIAKLITIFSNQAHAWFLESAFVQEIGVCPRPRAIKTIHVK